MCCIDCRRISLRIFGLHSCIKSSEEVFCKRFCRAVNQALPQLGDLAANRCLDRITQRVALAGGRELYLGATLAMARRAALPLEADGVALGGIDV